MFLVTCLVCCAVRSTFAINHQSHTLSAPVPCQHALGSVDCLATSLLKLDLSLSRAPAAASTPWLAPQPLRPPRYACLAEPSRIGRPLAARPRRSGPRWLGVGCCVRALFGSSPLSVTRLPLPCLHRRRTLALSTTTGCTVTSSSTSTSTLSAGHHVLAAFDGHDAADLETLRS